MEESVAEELSNQTIIPCFYFDYLSDKNLLRLVIFVDSPNLKDLKFELKNNELFFLSECYKNVRIRLPVEVIESEGTGNLPTKYKENSYCYEWRLKENVLDSKKIVDFDLFSRHLSWRDRSIQEEPDSLTSRSPISRAAEDVAESLKALNLDGAEKSRVGSYGFACRYTKKILPLEAFAVDIPDLENSDPEDRRLLRWEEERQSFDVDYYLADFFFERLEDDDESPNILQNSIFCVPYWYSSKRPTEYRLTSNQMEVLAGLPCKNFHLNQKERLEVLHSLLDIILSYAYDYRITDGKHNCESAWNISKLSATLSWFQVHRHVGDAVDSFFRRSLTYPLCRFWILSKVVFKDAIEIFRLGRRQILNCLIEIHTIFEADEDKKFLNELYINDYLIWIQQVHPNTIKNYLTHIHLCDRIKKENVFLTLLQIEEKAIDILKEDEENYDSWFNEFTSLSKCVPKRRIKPDSSSESTSADSSPDSEDSSSNSEDSSEDSESSLSEPDHEGISMVKEKLKT